MAPGTMRSTDGGYHGGFPPVQTSVTYGDSGGASRFFHCSDWNAEVGERLLDCDSVAYVAKASVGEKNAGIEGETTTINDGRQAISERPYLRNQTERLNSRSNY